MLVGERPPWLWSHVGGKARPHVLPSTPPARDADVKRIGQLSPEVTASHRPPASPSAGPSAAPSGRALRAGPVGTWAAMEDKCVWTPKGGICP